MTDANPSKFPANGGEKETSARVMERAVAGAAGKVDGVKERRRG